MMSVIHRANSARALLLERDAIVRERARAMLASEQFTTCAVDDLTLFNDLRRRLKFRVFVFGAVGGDDVAALESIADAEPLIVLADLQRPRDATHYRVAVPHAAVVDRGLRDPETLRRVLDPDSSPGRSEGAPDTVRHAFEPLGLTERQLEVVREALLGESSAAIARKLFISEPTVRNHLHAIYERVGVTGRRELLGRFVHGLLESEEAGT